MWEVVGETKARSDWVLHARRCWRSGWGRTSLCLRLHWRRLGKKATLPLRGSPTWCCLGYRREQCIEAPYLWIWHHLWPPPSWYAYPGVPPSKIYVERRGRPGDTKHAIVPRLTKKVFPGTPLGFFCPVSPKSLWRVVWGTRLVMLLGISRRSLRGMYNGVESHIFSLASTSSTKSKIFESASSHIVTSYI
jgi:hypothetical protein